jgi:competence protein ComEC
MKTRLHWVVLTILWASTAVRVWGQPAIPQMFAHCINVGQGDATLLEFPCGAVLIDAGGHDDESSGRLVAYLRNFFRRRQDLTNTLAAIYLTHPHKDHTYSLRQVVQNFVTKRFVDNGQDLGSGIAAVRWVRTNATQKEIVLREIHNDEVMKNGNKKGLTDGVIDPLRCDTCDPEILILSGQWDSNPGWTKNEFENNNNHSLVIRVDFGESSFLFTGDLEEDGIDSFLRHYETASSHSDILDVDIYHVGHHGSHNATTTNLLQALTPVMAVISAGKWDDGKGTKNPFTTWAYGHPRRKTVELLSQFVPGTRSEVIQVNLGTGPRRFFPTIVRKKIYATPWDGNTTIRATLHRDFRVTRNN